MGILLAPGPELRTARLVLRRWRPQDHAPFAALNRDERVMEHFVRTMTAGESARLIAEVEQCFEQLGYGLWALEASGRGFAGFVGLWPVSEQMPFAPAVELGWRLAPAFWGKGLATEAAVAAAEFGFAQLELGELVAYTAATNRRSQHVMQRLGMSTDPAEDFEHPAVPPEHRLSRHLLYRLGATGRRRPDGPG